MSKQDVMPGDRAMFVWPQPGVLKGAEGRVMRFETGTNDVIWVPDDYSLHPAALRPKLAEMGASSVLKMKFDGYSCHVDMLQLIGFRREYVVRWGNK